MSRVAVLGGGISGLACAYYLSKLGASTVKQITILESSKRLGGWLHSVRTDDGAVFELGPRSLRGFGKVSALSIQLAEELGLSDDVIPVLSSHVAAKNRYVYARNKLHVLPSSPLSMLRRNSLTCESLAWRLLKEVNTKPEPVEDDTIHNFMKRRFGQKIADMLVDPFIRGIFAGDCRELSMRSCLPDVFQYEQEHGSVVRGATKTKAVPLPDSDLVRLSRAQKWSIWSLRHGLGQIIDAMTSYLTSRHDVIIRSGEACTGLEFREDGSATVRTAVDSFDVDHVVAATNSKHLSALMPKSLSTLAAILSRIDYVTVGVVNLEFPGHVLKHQGFGHLVPSSEPSDVLGVVYDSCAFPEHDTPRESTTRLTCMMGGTWFWDLFGDPASVRSSRLEHTALEALREQLGIHEEPRRVIVNIHQDCIPQYKLGHSALMESVNSEIAAHNVPLHLIGAPYLGVSVNDCISHARQTAQRISGWDSR